MVVPSVEKLDRLAIDVLSGIDNSLFEQNIVEFILDTYRQFCRSDEALRLDISEMPITDEIRLRPRFESLCFSTFLASLQSSKFLTDKKWFVKRPNQRLIGLFDGAIAAALIELCNNAGMSELREITLVAIDPKPTFGLGDHLDPLNRLEEYRAAFVKERGSELERFGKWIGKALDGPNYPLFEIIGGTFGEPLLQLSDYAMADVLKRGANLPLPMNNQEDAKEQLRTQIAGCNFAMAKALVVRSLGGSIIPKELAALLDGFTENPCLETAAKLIEYDQKFRAVFELARGGGFTEQLFRKGDIE
ncbi:MAG: hypothetical protein KGZ93_05490 [Actinobacteria bacterium]|nr:hypothetical protein [Actinomycetota bacterium]